MTIKYNVNSLDGCQTGSGWKRKQELEERCKHSTVDFKGTVGIKYLRNGKHFPSFYHVIEWKISESLAMRIRNAVKIRATSKCFHGSFEFSQTFTSVSIYNSIET